MSKRIAVEWLGCQDYTQIVKAQRQRRESVISGEATEVVWTLEHPPIVTLGRRGGDVARVRDHGIDVVQTERGGQITYHGPGQLVGYFIVDLKSRRWQTKLFVCGIERGIITWLAEQGIDSHTIVGRPGVYVDGAKVASIGLHIRRGVTMHGFALNYAMDLTPFSLFSVCGTTDQLMTSVVAQIPKNQSGIDKSSPLSTVGDEVLAKIFVKIDDLHR